MGNQPLIVLSDDSQRTSGKDAKSMNITAGQAVAESVRTTLGPKGMDKMLVSDAGDVVVTNDGVTILKEMDIEHPAANMIVEVAETQEDEVGDGTTTAVVEAGELLEKAEELLDQDIHATTLAQGYREAAEEAKNILEGVAIDVDEDDTETLAEYAVGAWADVTAATRLFDAIRTDAHDLGADASRVLIPESPRHVAKAAAARVGISEHCDFVLEADLT